MIVDCLHAYSCVSHAGTMKEETLTCTLAPASSAPEESNSFVGTNKKEEMLMCTLAPEESEDTCIQPNVQVHIYVYTYH